MKRCWRCWCCAAACCAAAGGWPRPGLTAGGWLSLGPAAGGGLSLGAVAGGWLSLGPAAGGGLSLGLAGCGAWPKEKAALRGRPPIPCCVGRLDGSGLRLARFTMDGSGLRLARVTTDGSGLRLACVSLAGSGLRLDRATIDGSGLRLARVTEEPGRCLPLVSCVEKLGALLISVCRVRGCSVAGAAIISEWPERVQACACQRLGPCLRLPQAS